MALSRKIAAWPQEWPPQSWPHSEIRRFLALWLSALIFAALLLCGGLIFSVSSMASKNAALLGTSRQLQSAHDLQVSLLTADREQLLWRATGLASHQQVENAALSEADKSLANLRRQAGPGDMTQLGDLHVRLHQSQRETRPDFQSLLPMTRAFRIRLQSRLGAQARSGQRLDRWADRAGIAVFAGALIVICWGAARLWLVVFKPLWGLARAVRAFGKGERQTRATVARPDEMGMLCETFNVMAAAIEERDRERLDFVATVAHDLKNPLVVIGGVPRLLRRYDLEPEAREHWLGAIERAARKMEADIADLQDAVQIETGRLQLRCENLNLDEIVADVARDFAPGAPQHHVTVKAKPCAVNGDRKRLERVLLNLLSNAVKYSAAGSSVTVEVGVTNDLVLLQVRDEGVGIAPEDLPRLFQPFSRLENTCKSTLGTGLGLSSVKKIVEAHGGAVQVRSELGQGATFEVSLPLSGRNDATLPEKTLMVFQSSSQSPLAQ